MFLFVPSDTFTVVYVSFSHKKHRNKRIDENANGEREFFFRQTIVRAVVVFRSVILTDFMN